jgi:polygalacturonase
MRDQPARHAPPVRFRRRRRRAGGGHVVIPAGGTFLTGAIHLLSNVDLHVEQNATILFSQNPTVDTCEGLWSVVGASASDPVGTATLENIAVTTSTAANSAQYITNLLVKAVTVGGAAVTAESKPHNSRARPTYRRLRRREALARP